MATDEQRAKWREYSRKYGKTLGGLAAQLRKNHGLNLAESRKWARVLTEDDTRCAICGVPAWKLKKMSAWRCGGFKMNKRLTLDHLTPGINDGKYRACCHSCNYLRGANELHDAEVLEIMRKWYLRIYTLKNMWWLNTHVEDGVCVGGHAELPGRAKKLARLKEAE